LLRDVFETAATFAEAKRRLETTPIARPVIYTLIGCARDERCVIERTEEGFATRIDDTAAANNWLCATPAWEARVSSEAIWTRTYDEAAANSRKRREGLAAWPGEFARGGFDWVAAPVLNRNTRVAVEMCPALGVLRAGGYELLPGGDLPVPVTLTCELAAAA
jgi:hypothetical protein